MGEDTPNFYFDAIDLLSEGKDIETIIISVYAIGLNRGLIVKG